MTLRRARVCRQRCWITALALAGLWFMAGKECLATEPCHLNVEFAHVDRLLAKRDYQNARAILAQLKGCPNLSQRAAFNIGWLYGRSRDFSQAMKIFQSIPPDVPDRLTHGYAIALSEFELGDYQSAVQSLSTLRSAGIFDAECADLLGVSYSKLGRFQEAYSILAESLKTNPADTFAYINLVTLFVDTGDLVKAEQVADEAVTHFPQNTEAFVMRGSIKMSLGNLEEARNDFATAARLSPQDPDPRFFTALSDYKQSRFAQAADELKEAAASGIIDSDLHYLRAECLIRLDPPDSAESMRELDRAIELNGKSVSARVLRGKLLLEGGHPREALTDLNVARRLEPEPARDSRNATYYLARAYLALGKKDQAKDLFAQLNAQFSSSNPDTLSGLSARRVNAALHP
jgi:tetratricopeptide (TPR) repeat protein